MDTKLMRKYLGDRLVNFVSIAIFGFIVAITYPKFVITPEVLANTKKEILDEQKKSDGRLEHRLNVTINTFTITTANLEESILRREQNDILDKADKGLAKERDRVRLKEISERIKQIHEIKTASEAELRKQMAENGE